jgi:hypothetical protein
MTVDRIGLDGACNRKRTENVGIEGLGSLLYWGRRIRHLQRKVGLAGASRNTADRTALA